MLFCLPLLFAVLAAPQIPPEAILDPVGELLRIRLEQAGPRPRIEIGHEVVHAAEVLPAVYEERGYRPVWIDQGALSQLAKTYLSALREVDRDGLRPANYHLDLIETLLARVERAGAASRQPVLGDLDLLLTDSFLILGAHLVSGCVNPETFDPEWIAARREVDLAGVLKEVLAAGRLRESLDALLPNHEGYFRLRDALARYRVIDSAGGWPMVPEGPALRLGDESDRVVPLTTRLAATGDLRLEHASPNRFDEGIEAGVRRFQARHGLDADGVAGAMTLAAMNVPTAVRVRQIELNLERWRWLPQDLGRRHVLVNIPDFRLDLVEDGRSILTMAAIVGRPYRRTPVFSDQIRYLVLNPFWEVPPMLAVQDKLPLIRKDPDYISREGFRVFRGWGEGREEIDPNAIDWTSVPGRGFPYRLRQDPGPQNALGQIKFMFPNRFNVYLHDTPARELFAKTSRDFSSGCIRIEKPLDLALALLSHNPAWTRESLTVALRDSRDRTVLLPRPVPVHLLYWTTWAEEDGTVQFRSDIYDRDRRLEEVLRQPPPTA